MQPRTCTSTTGAKYPWEQQLIHFASNWSTSCQLPLSPRTVHACVWRLQLWVPLPGSPVRSGRGVSVCPSLPAHPFPLPALWPAEEVALLPRYESSLLPIVFLASKLQRLIFCDRSNLSGKAEAHTESAPLNFPKPLQSFHNVSLYWMQQRDSCLKKATKIYS